MANAVDDAGGADQDPEPLHRPDAPGDRDKGTQIDRENQADAVETVRRIELALKLLVMRAGAVLVEHVSVLRDGRIKLAAAQQLGCDAAGLRAVRVLGRLAGCVMLSMHRGPFACRAAGAEPGPAPEK